MQQNSEGALTPTTLCRCLPFLHTLPGNLAWPPNQPGGVSTWSACTSAACLFLFLWCSPFSQYLSSRLRTVYPHIYTWPVVESPLAAARTSDCLGITVWHQLCRKGGGTIGKHDTSLACCYPAHLICSLGLRAAAHVCLRCKWITIGWKCKEPHISMYKCRYCSYDTFE